MRGKIVKPVHTKEQLYSSSPPLNDVKSSAPLEEKVEDEEEKSEDRPPTIVLCEEEGVAVGDEERLFTSNAIVGTTMINKTDQFRKI
ncbi:hypothetical protein E3N88_38077 [Mikania micrantha]|uniref:Uncharacterized protein n=1 Tax=Mikania micrantha TaxID=192012 RepID=A0A5N6LTA1_9ASTR|nr:hypothetical protein E3N88_38077 [Mikania micrantha]